MTEFVPGDGFEIKKNKQTKKRGLGNESEGDDDAFGSCHREAAFPFFFALENLPDPKGFP